MLNYFGYGTNRDLEMMAAMIGREKIEGQPGKLLGFELCIQKINDIPGEVLKTSPVESSPREIIVSCFDENFELYIIRPKINGVTYGTIWQLTEEENDLVREWEMLDFGMQEDIKAMAMDSQGKVINVTTHGSLSQSLPINRVVEGDDYEDYLVSKEKILEVARKTRQEYFERIGK